MICLAGLVGAGLAYVNQAGSQIEQTTFILVKLNGLTSTLVNLKCNLKFKKSNKYR